jgi:hypothetical protein
MQPTTIRTGDPRELLALVPFQLGFQPHESAVVVSLRGARSRVGLVARVDLDDLADPAAGGQVARTLVNHLTADGASAVVCVLFTEEDLQSTAPSRGRRAVRHLAAAAQYFLGEPTCWVVGPHGYYSLGCTDSFCCPAGGRPLRDLQSTQVGAQMVLQGAWVAASRDELVPLAPASPSRRRSATRAGDRWLARRPAGGEPASAHAWRRESLGLWRAQVEATVPGSMGGALPTVLGRLQAALSDVLVRDAVLLTFVAGADRVADRVLAGDGGEEVSKVLRALVDPDEGRAPDADRAARARAVLDLVVRHSPQRLQAPALTLLAVLSWWEGDGARAGVLVERALASEPGYRLAVLIEETLTAGMAPGWLRQPPD